MAVNCMKVHDDDKIVRLNDVNFEGDWIAYDHDTKEKIWDSRIDGYDVSPAFCLCPVVWITIEDGVFCFDLMTHWEEGVIE